MPQRPSDSVARVCPECKHGYFASQTRLKWGRETYCSRECSYRGRARGLRTGHEVVCGVCERPIRRTPSQLKKAKYGTVFCSRICHYKGRGLGLTLRRVTRPYRRRTTKESSERGKRSYRNPPKKCITCGKPFKYKTKTKRCSRQCYLADKSIMSRGAGNPSYIDGRSSKKRCWRGWSWAATRRRVLDRDGRRCVDCGTTEGKLHVHHIRPWRESRNNTDENLITVCTSCHAKREVSHVQRLRKQTRESSGAHSRNRDRTEIQRIPISDMGS